MANKGSLSKVIVRVKGPIKKQSPLAWILLAAILFYILTSAEVVMEDEIITGNTYQVPVVEEQFEWVKVPYGRKNCGESTYDVSEVFVSKWKANTTSQSVEIYQTCNLTVTNNEAMKGEFTYIAIFNKGERTVDSPETTKIIKPNETINFFWKYPKEEYGYVFSCDYKAIDAPTISKCEFVDPLSYKTVRRLINVTVYENVTEESITEGEFYFKNQFFGYEQRFYLGY